MPKRKLVYLSIIITMAIMIITTYIFFAINVYGTELKGAGERISNILTATVTVKKVTPPPSGGGGTPDPVAPTPPPPLPPIIIPKPVPTFADITVHWAGHNIKTLASMGIIAGYPDGTFKPNANITRAEFVVMLIRALGLEQDAVAANTFRDAAKVNWARGAIGAAYKAGLIFGYSDGTFDASQQITRAEVAVILSRVIYKALMPVTLTNAADFADVATIPNWAKDAVKTAARGGLVRGFPGNVFRAGNMTTRAEVATMLYRLVVPK